jgi:hypothetical protein
MATDTTIGIDVIVNPGAAKTSHVSWITEARAFSGRHSSLTESPRGNWLSEIPESASK